MKFTIHQNALLQLIQTSSKAVAVRSTKQVLMGILLEAEADTLSATAYDLELGIQSAIRADDENGFRTEESGAIVLPARYLLDVVKKLPSDMVSFDIHNNYTTDIRCGQVEFHLHGIDSAEFPKLPSFHNVEAIELPTQALQSLIRSTSFATSTSEVRPILTGIHLEFGQDSLTFTATDGLRLATKSVPFSATPSEDEEREAILPAKSLNELLKVLSDDTDTVSIQFTNSHSLFSIGNTLFYTRLIEGTYPDTTRIIPTTQKTEIIVSSSEFMSAIDRAALIARDRDNHMIRMELTNQNLTVSSSSPEIGNVSESMTVLNKTGDDVFIAFNAKYVLDALKALGDDEISIYFNGSNQPFVLRKHEQDDTLQLISPVLMR